MLFIRNPSVLQIPSPWQPALLGPSGLRRTYDYFWPMNYTWKWNRALNHESIKTHWIMGLRPSRTLFPFGIKIKVSTEVDLLHQLAPLSVVARDRAENKQVRSKLRLSSTTFVIRSILIGTNIGEKMAGSNVHCLHVVRSVDLSLCSPMIYDIFFTGKQSNQLCK